jgi:hypothetical protein
VRSAQEAQRLTKSDAHHPLPGPWFVFRIPAEMDFLDFLGAEDSPAAAVVAAESSSDEEEETTVSPAAKGPSPLALSLARLRQHLATRDTLEQINKQGFVVLDNVFEQALVRKQ